MLDWYQHIPEHISPVVFTAGFFSLYWYAAMYAIAIGTSGFVLWRQTRARLTADQYIDLAFNLVLGILVGSRLGYVLLYNLSFYAAHPLAVVWPFDMQSGAWIGIFGMSYYGGLVGATVGLWLFTRKHALSFWRVADTVALCVPAGYFFGRIGNFLNAELYGRVTEQVWGMYFPYAPAGDMVLRHPSQLYEAFFEGAVLLVVLFFIRKRFHFAGALAAVYTVGYGSFRCVIEFFREPDPQVGFVFGHMTLGQLISIIVCAAGTLLFFWLQGKKHGTMEGVKKDNTL